MYFAHEVAKTSGSFLDNLQKPSIAFPIITILAIFIAIGSFWLLKRFTCWEFPNNKRSK